MAETTLSGPIFSWMVRTAEGFLADAAESQFGAVASNNGTIVLLMVTLSLIGVCINLAFQFRSMDGASFFWYRSIMRVHNKSDPSIHVEPLAQIIDRARIDNGVTFQVPREELSSELTQLYRDLFLSPDITHQGRPTPWDLVAEETLAPGRHYKVFGAALAAGDPLAVLQDPPLERSPSELFLVQKRINSFARTQRPTIEKSLPDLKTANWARLSKEQQAVVRRHIEHLNLYYYKTQKRSPDPMENAINLAVHELAEIFAKHTHFDGIPTDLPYTAPSRFVQFLCHALAPVVHPNKVNPGALSKRWRRLKGPSDNSSV